MPKKPNNAKRVKAQRPPKEAAITSDGTEVLDSKDAGLDRWARDEVEARQRGHLFKKGNEGGPGGHRVGAGRKPDQHKKAIDALCDHLVKNPRFVDEEGDEPKLVSLYDRAVQTLEKAMLATDEMGNVAPVAMRAATTILHYRLGKPRETLEIKGGAKLDITHKLSQIREAALQKELSA